jgi:hypothetical protein
MRKQYSIYKRIRISVLIKEDVALNYNIRKSTLQEIEPLMKEYFKTLNGVTDDFWEHHILSADVYLVLLDHHSIGYFTIYNKEKITQFYIQEKHINLAQPIFKQLLEEYKIKTAFVATCDQLFLSLCLDYHSRIEKQAYFFDGTVTAEVKAPEYKRELFFGVKPEELEEVKEKTGDFFDFVTLKQLEAKDVMLYKLCDNDEVLGYGIAVPNKLQTQYWAVGMIVLEKNRCKGVGRSIQLHLADITRENGHIPISGCWYYNHLSKKTIESAGRYSKTRLLNIIFEER